MVMWGIPMKLLVADKIERKIQDFCKFTVNAVADCHAHRYVKQ